jgi:hypothetical protein
MNPSFTPINAAAKTGSFHLLLDVNGHLHCGQFDPAERRFVYSCGAPIAALITQYASREK